MNVEEVGNPGEVRGVENGWTYSSHLTWPIRDSGMGFAHQCNEVDSETVLAQFNRLMQELLRGSIARNTFRPWEIDILLDIEDSQVREATKRETLRRYQRAVQRQMEKGAPTPMKLSEYLAGLRTRRREREPAAV